MAIRTATVVMRMDTGDYEAGAQRVAAAERSKLAAVRSASRELAAVTRAATADPVSHFGGLEAAGPANLAYVKELAARNEKIATDQGVNDKRREAATKRYVALMRQVAAAELIQTMTAKQRASLQEAIVAKRAVDEPLHLQRRLAAEQAAAGRSVAIERGAQAARTAAARAGAAERIKTETAGASSATLVHRLGGRVMARRELAYGMTVAAGQTSPEISLLSQGMIFGGAAGAAMVGIAAVGRVYTGLREQAKGLAEAQERHRDATRDSARWMSQLAESYVATTRAGGAFADRALGERDAAESLMRARRKRAAEMGWLDTAAVGFDVMFRGPKASEVRRRGEEDAEWTQRMQRARRLQAASAQERTIARGQALEDAQTRKSQIRIEGMYESPLKRQRALDLRQREELKAFNRESAEYYRVNRLARQMALDRGDTAAAEAADTDQAEFNASRRAEGDLILGAHRAQQLNLVRLEATEEGKSKTARLNRVAAETHELNEARIRATTEGHARERALLEEQFAWERHEYHQAERDETRLLETQAQRRIELNKRLGESNRELIRQAPDRGVNMRLMAREIDEQQAFHERLIAQRKRETGGPLSVEDLQAIQQATRAFERERVGGVVAGELGRRETAMQQYERFKADMEKAVAGNDPVLAAEAARRGVTVRQLADEMEAAKAAELAPQRQHGGRFTDATSLWKEMQTQISATDTGRQTVAEQKRTTQSIEDLRAEVEKWRTQGVLR